MRALESQDSPSRSHAALFALPARNPGKEMFADVRGSDLVTQVSDSEVFVAIALGVINRATDAEET